MNIIDQIILRDEFVAELAAQECHYKWRDKQSRQCGNMPQYVPLGSFLKGPISMFPCPACKAKRLLGIIA